MKRGGAIRERTALDQQIGDCAGVVIDLPDVVVFAAAAIAVKISLKLTKRLGQRGSFGRVVVVAVENRGDALCERGGGPADDILVCHVASSS
jgi:hypothetical protein